MKNQNKNVTKEIAVGTGPNSAILKLYKASLGILTPLEFDILSV